ncbi:MAG: S41 family peptidase [Muribaculaceae bacterium]|nr:S41 family peptidase [Muribaculaceae bacterium]
MMKKFLLHRVVAVTVTCCCVLTTLAKSDDDAAVARNLDVFNRLYKELNTYYVDSLDVSKSIKTAIDAMLDEVDPYTEYIPASEQEDFMVVSSGEYGGIGSYIMERNGHVYFSEPYENSPAVRAGIKSGDRIVSIDGESVEGLSSDKVSERLKGDPSTRITIEVARPYCGPDSIKTFTLMREKIKMDPVTYYGVTRGDMGYIKLNTYNEHSASQVREAVESLMKTPGLKGIVLDLRGNGGGLLESAVQIVGMFVPKGTQVLQTRGRTKNEEKTYKTTEAPIAPDMPLVALIDGGTASAAEITAGALQDLDRGVVIGSRSFGKGLVQTTRPLPYDGMLKVTIAKYYIPSGRLIQEIDYSHRAIDGTAQRIPDSLTTVFHTAHGREVRDGGGITPDFKIDYPELNRLVYNIVRDHWAFDFATKYTAEHPTIPPVEQFKITDEIFNAFKQSIDPKRFQYDKVCETGLEKLRKTAEVEGYMNDETREAFDRLEGLLKHDLDRDLDQNRKPISDLLAQEIIKNYYFQRGQVIYDLKEDEALDKAHEVFTTPGMWKKTLNLGK